MSSSSSRSPSEEYKQRLQAREARVAHFEKTHIRLGNVRLLLVTATLIAAWEAFERDALSGWWLLVPVALFVATAVFHAKVLRERSRAERAAEVYRKGLARIEDRWIGTGQRGDRIDTSSSFYATDLDLFGEGSLFELLSLARSRMGEDTLAQWLLSPATVSEIRERQSAVNELRERLDLREEIAVLGEDAKAGVHPEALMRWAEAPNQLSQRWLRWAAVLLAVLAVITAIVWAETGTKTFFFAVVIVETIVTAILHKQVAEVLHSAEQALDDLRLLSSLFSRIEREQFDAPRAKAVRQELFSHHLPGSQAIAKLRNIVDHIRSLENPVMKARNIPLLYAVQTAYAAEAWRKAHGSAVRSWLSAIGEIEALLSLSGYSYEHPSDPFPVFVEGSPCFRAIGLGHPLIPDARCVRNDVSVCETSRVLLISGSNMSGKSTLMRAVGINVVLAMAGAPVRAQYLTLSSLQLGASILVNDSLQEGSSRFYAEITRLREICDLAEQHPPVLFLLDELLQGTNSKDRLIGAEGVVQTLLASGAIGMISTHDLALTNIGSTAAAHIHNVHLQDAIVDGKMTFDFRLHDGVVTKSNGIELMRMIGLKV